MSTQEVKRYRWHNDGMWWLETEQERKITAQWVPAADFDARIAALEAEIADQARILEIRRGEINEERQDVDRLAAQLSEAQREVREIRMSTLQECWDAINKHIKRGSLQGNDCDESAQRNGFVLATNLIMELISASEGK